MPISSWQAISDIMAEVVRIDPKSVLDLGCGFGVYGVLCRNYLDAMHGRCRKDQWQIVIRGFEAAPGYRNPAWLLYNAVLVERFDTDDIQHQQWDLVLMIDSLEHLEPEAGAAFLDKLVANNKHVIVSVPNGPMEQGAAFGNEYERHRTTFHEDAFARFSDHKRLHLGLCHVVSIPGKS